MADLKPPGESTDIFSLSDQVLSDRLQFVEEIGFGNWGSVWLCRPKPNPESSGSRPDKVCCDTKIAVKLVHRSKTKTTAARVRSLWNEMKIVRTFKNDPHPSIIPFHSFIITPSYALITMTFLPNLVPVEVEESKASPWFRSLLSGVEFLHKRGVVHNDIKPANILLSESNVPVLVDFGFAEKYEISSSKAFHSDLSYGTPEYLSPERARGVMHDTRKSDVWALGITFFEILVGRTPFEYSEGEQFTTKEDLERYWSRTLRGKWVGSWKFSKPIQKLLRRMITPNADLRCTASDAMSDAYWHKKKDAEPNSNGHRRTSSTSTSNSSLVFAQDVSKLMDMLPPWATRSTNHKDSNFSPPADRGKSAKDNKPSKEVLRSKSQPKLRPKRAPVPQLPANLSPVKATPPNNAALATITSSRAKENRPVSSNTLFGNARGNANSKKALAVLGVRRESLLRDKMLPITKQNLTSLSRENLSPHTQQNLPAPPQKERNKTGRALIDLTAMKNGARKENGKENQGKQMAQTDKMRDERGAAKEKDRVKERVKEWEREKERLREMERLEEMERERDEDLYHAEEPRKSSLSGRGNQEAHAIRQIPTASVNLSSPDFNSPNDVLPRSSGLMHNLRTSIDKGVRFYKSSLVAGRSPPPHSLSVGSEDQVSRHESWEDEALLRDVKSSLPVVRHAVHNEQLAADNRLDRMQIWMNSIEKVVEDARQTFASADMADRPLPPLPISPMSRSTSNSRANRSTRLPRKILAASQIFAHEPDHDESMIAMLASAYVSADNTNVLPDESLPLPKAGRRHMSELGPHTPRPRRATVSALSPEAVDIQSNLDADNGSPSKHKEKSKSQANLLRHITPVLRLEFESQKPDFPAQPQRLSEVIDKSLFVARPGGMPTITIPNITFSDDKSVDFDDLNSSPLQVEPYPPRKNSVDPSHLDLHSQRRIEGVYDRFLMSTSGVKRNGRGYQSDNAGPVFNIAGSGTLTGHSRIPRPRAFHSTRRMPAPVSSDDQRKTLSVDELGLMTDSPGPDTPVTKDDGNTTITLVRRAFKVITGKTVSRRVSRIS